MKITETVSTTLYEQLVETVCDLCGALMGGDTTEWPCPEDSEFHYGTTEVRLEKHWSCYEDYEPLERVSYDICPKCFEHKLMPWLAKQGAKQTLKDA